jgi:acyl-CoA synthetase (NDP forming)
VGELRVLWAAESIAVVGASTRPGGPGRLAVDFLRASGYAGRVLPIHPSATEIAGLPAYPSVTAAGGAELALIVVPPAAVGAAVDDCAAAGVGVAIVGTSGFAETGAEGRAAQDCLVARARASGMRLVGPNCIGAVGFGNGLIASFSPLFAALPPEPGGGRIGFASASGALGFGTVSLALERGIGLLAAVSTGNEADVGTLEVLTALAAEPECTALLGYVESLTDGPALRTLAASGRPTVLLVAGRSTEGARAAASHTGALATPDRVVDGALRQYGIVRVSDVDELLDVGDALDLCAGRMPAGSRIAVVTTSGGSGILAADAAAAHGLPLATLSRSTVDVLKGIVPAYGSVANPIDVTASVMSDRTLVARTLAAVAADPAVDIVLVCFCVLTGDDVGAIVRALEAAATASGKPVLVARTGADALAPTAATELRAAGIPTYPTPGRAVRAAAALVRTATRTRVPAEPVASGAVPRTVREILDAAGARIPRGRIVRDAIDAGAAVDGYGGRAVFKVVVPGLVHKTEVGGVALGVTRETAAGTYHRLRAIDGATGVLVEEQLDGGVEVLIGIAPSPLGPALTIGAGGVLTELLDDAATRLLPVTEAEIRGALAGTKVARLLEGQRGRPPADVDALVDLALRISRVPIPATAALDLNPVLVRPEGAVVLDAALVDRED